MRWPNRCILDEDFSLNLPYYPYRNTLEPKNYKYVDFWWRGVGSYNREYSATVPEGSNIRIDADTAGAEHSFYVEISSTSKVESNDINFLTGLSNSNKSSLLKSINNSLELEILLLLKK